MEDSAVLPGASEPDGEGLPWAVFEALKGKTVTTLVWSRQFTIVGVASDLISLRVQQTKRMKDVGKAQLQRTLAELKENGILALQDVRAYAPDTSSYVAALLVQVPGVTWDKAKKSLLFGGAPMARPPASPAKIPSGRPRAPTGQVSFDTSWTQQGSKVLRSWRKLPLEVQREIAAIAMAEAAYVVREMEACDSPPEQLLASRLLSEARSVSLVEDFELRPQHRVQTRDGPLHADFLVKGSIDGVPVSLLVECDGHTYHDRTKEQAAKDRQRDRSLKLTDYEVIRFTASEIMSDPEGCALETFSQMRAVARRAGPRP